ncbi:MAG: phasin family protein [Rhodocyclaceae bacterium]|nr:phasin family protein [Rhodocyclaceae bacterium]
MSNPFTTEQFADIQKAQINGLLTLANTAFAGVERLAALNLNTARTLFEDGAGSARALLGAKDAQDFFALQSTLAQPAFDKALIWSRSAYEIGNNTREELNKVFEAQLAEASQSIDTSLDALVKNAPAGTDAAVSASVGAFRSALGATASVYETLNKAARQVSDYAEANLAATAKPAPKGKKAQ